MKIPYKALKKGKEKPLLPIAIRSPKTGIMQRFYALVDSGSDSCFFDAETGEAIGLDVKAGREGKIYGVVPGKWIQQYCHDVEIGFSGRTFKVNAGFVYGLNHHGYGILGQSGFFDQVSSVIFEKQKGVFEVVID